ncbi:MAG: hypothetical protein AAB794_00120 [Patescibacteria group bacterium]|mgnify:CR=1 FL=1
MSAEEYSRKTYEDAEDKAARTEKAWKPLRANNFAPDAFTRMAERARQRVENLYGKGQAEAISLNKEYDRLLGKAEEAMKALKSFEKEKLRMSEETAS